MQPRATQGNLSNAHNSRNNQTNNAVKVARKCDNVYGQISPLQMHMKAEKPFEKVYRLSCSNTTVLAEQERSKNGSRTDQEQSKNRSRTEQL